VDKLSVQMTFIKAVGTPGRRKPRGRGRGKRYSKESIGNINEALKVEEIFKRTVS